MKKDSVKKLLQAVPPLALEFLKGAVRAFGQYVTKHLLELLP